MANHLASKLHNTYFHDLMIYKDARLVELPSGQKFNRGAIIYQSNQIVIQSCTSLSHSLSVLDAKIHAAVSPLETAFSFQTTR